MPAKTAIAAIRVSSVKQGTDGDSPDAQKEQIERFAINKGIIIKKFFVFLESASKEQQPMQEAIDYCKKNKVDLFVIKSIDRFTRGGSYSYDHLKMQLESCDVSLVDIYGIISSEKVNTLDHLGFEYKWSVYSPTKKAEILEAERAQDEMRDIMSRMIGAEIRYTKIGYWMRQPPYGYRSEKVETPNGKRCVLVPEEKEADFIIKVFELRARGTMSDQAIADKLNALGYRTRLEYLRGKTDRTKVIGQRGGLLMDAKTLQRYVQNPIYAGVICEKWTNNLPIQAKFSGLIGVELFNRANKGKRTITENNSEIQLHKQEVPVFQHIKNKNNPDFPYKRVVMCPDCDKPLLGSAARGKMGKYYPAYHCDRGHYFRVPQERFNQVIESFVKDIKLKPRYLEAVEKAVVKEWLRRQEEQVSEDQAFAQRIDELEKQIKLASEKILLVSSATVIKTLEDNVKQCEEQITKLNQEKEGANMKKPTNMQSVMQTIKYFLEHLDELVLQQIDPIKKANYFGVFFDQAPNFAQIESGTQNPSLRPRLNKIFTMDYSDEGNLEGPVRLELTTPCLKGRCSNQLSYGPG